MDTNRCRYTCWTDDSYRLYDGYTKLDIRQAGVRRVVQGHRLAYEILVGPIPHGMVLDHLCRNRACYNPAHLQPVSRAENGRRQVNHNTLKTHCKRGHEFTPENTYMKSMGKRQCRECKRKLERSYYLNGQ